MEMESRTRFYAGLICNCESSPRKFRELKKKESGIALEFPLVGRGMKFKQ